MKNTTEQERQIRENAVEQSLASIRLEGLEPGPHVHEIYGRYINGELTLEEMGNEMEALHDREYVTPTKVLNHNLR